MLRRRVPPEREPVDRDDPERDEVERDPPERDELLERDEERARVAAPFFAAALRLLA